MPAPPPSLDALIPRLRARAADPERRTYVQQTQFSRQVASMDLGGMLSLGRTLGGLLRTSVAMQREGRIDPDGVAMADELQRQMETPVDDGLPAPADEATVEAAEAVLRLTLPLAMRRVWTEVADGGFGPGFGLLPLSRVVKEYGTLRSPGMMPRGREWPAGLLPVLSQDPGWDCIEASTGRVIAWDPEELSERSSEARFQASFSEVAPSVEAWLDAWLGSRTHAEQRDEMMAEFTSPAYQAKQATRRARPSGGCASRSGVRWASPTRAGRRSSGAGSAGRRTSRTGQLAQALPQRPGPARALRRRSVASAQPRRYHRPMRLLPWEEDRLQVFAAAELARRHLAAGLRLNQPEAVALICDAMLEAARAGATYEGVEAAGRGAVGPQDVLDGVRELVPEVRLEVLLGDGTRVIALLDPIGRGTPPDPLGPGALVIGDDADIEVHAAAGGDRARGGEHVPAPDPGLVALPVPPRQPAARLRPRGGPRLPPRPPGRRLGGLGAR